MNSAQTVCMWPNARYEALRWICQTSDNISETGEDAPGQHHAHANRGQARLPLTPLGLPSIELRQFSSGAVSDVRD